MGVYIDSVGAASLKTYQYKGADLSKVYIHLLQPMNTWLLQHVIPMNIAPNTMSLMGLSTTTLACIVAAYYNISFDSLTLPPVLSLYVAVSFFIYQTIDNLDGRQARRTNSASPLGLLFDHGVDALTTTIGALTLGSIYNFGIVDIRYQYLFWLCGNIPFIFATCTEYYTGELILDVINGPSDGMCLCMLFCIIQYFIPNIWSSPIHQYIPVLSYYIPILPSLPMNMLILIAGFAGIIPTVINNLYSISRHRNLLNGPIQLLLPFFSIIIMSSIWLQYSPSLIYHTNTRVFITTIGILFANIVCKLMLAHITARQYSMYRIELIPYLLAVTHALLVSPQYQLITEQQALYGLLIYVITLHAHFIIHVIDDMTEILHINCFTIDKQKIHPVVNTHPNGTNGNTRMEHGKQ